MAAPQREPAGVIVPKRERDEDEGEEGDEDAGAR
jgi:hypothetical protein